MTGRIGLAIRIAGCNLRQAKLSTTLAVLLIAMPFAVAVVLAPGVVWYGSGGGAEVETNLVVEGVLVVVVFVVVRSVLAVRERARARTGALLVLNGARPGDLRWAQGSEALAMAVAGALLGCVLPGVVLDALVGRAPYADLRITATYLVGVPLVAALATLPGSTRSTTSGFRPALAGRRPSPPLRIRTPIIGVVLLGSGAALASGSLSRSFAGGQLAIGAVAAVVGLAFVASAVLAAIEPATRRLGVAGRLAGRTLARQRHRTGPILVLVVLFLAAAIVAASGLQAITAAKAARGAVLAQLDVRTLPPDTVLLVAGGDQSEVPESVLGTVHGVLPDASVAPVDVLGGPTTPVTITSWNPATGAFGTGAVGVATPELLRALGLEAHQADVDAGRVLVLDPLAVARSGSGEAPSSITIRDDAQETSTTREAVVVWPDQVMTELPAALVPPRSLDGSVEVRGGSLLFHSGSAIDATTRARLVALTEHPGTAPDQGGATSTSTGAADHVFWTEGHATRLVLPGEADHEVAASTRADLIVPVTVYADQVRAYLVAALLAVVVGVAAAVGLSATQRRRDDELLAQQGARPSFRRQVGAWEAGLLTLVAGVLATAIAAATAAIGIAASNAYGLASPYQGPQIAYVQPWVLTGAVLVGLPLVLAAVAFVCTPSIRRARVRRLTDD